MCILAFLLMTLGCGLATEKKHPGDSELIKNFKDHRSEFDELIQMFRTEIWEEWVGVSLGRLSSSRSVAIGQSGTRVKPRLLKKHGTKTRSTLVKKDSLIIKSDLPIYD